MFRVVENVRKKHFDWVSAVLEHRRWSPRRLAVEAGIDPSTLSRFLKDSTNSRMLNSFSIEKIEKASGIPAFETNLRSPNPLPADPSKSDGVPADVSKDADIALAIKARESGHNGIEAWELTTRCLEHRHYLPGDILIIDRNRSPVNGNIVRAEVLVNGSVETVFRVLEQPYLLSCTNDTTRTLPILIDRSVQISGVLVGMQRINLAA